MRSYCPYKLICVRCFIYMYIPHLADLIYETFGHVVRINYRLNLFFFIFSIYEKTRVKFAHLAVTMWGKNWFDQWTLDYSKFAIILKTCLNWAVDAQTKTKTFDKHENCWKPHWPSVFILQREVQRENLMKTKYPWHLYKTKLAQTRSIIS